MRDDGAGPPSHDTGADTKPGHGASAALESVVRVLRCPVCGDPVSVDAAVLACGRGHRFDIARQGYVNLVAGRGGPGTADSAAMVAARESFLGQGHFERIASAAADAAVDVAVDFAVDAGTNAAFEAGPDRAFDDRPDGAFDDRPDGEVVVDLAGGTGYYLAHLLDRRADAVGICVDLSTPALRRAARAHARAAAIGADAWGVLPVASGAVSVLLSVFGPRNPDEIERVLGPDGTLIVVSPTAAHLQELSRPLGLLAVDPRKTERQAAAFSRFRPLARRTEHYSIVLDRDDLASVVGMGPSALHIDARVLRQRVDRMPEQTAVTVSVEVASYRR